MLELFRRDVPLAAHTTIGLGGAARFFYSARTVEQVRDALLCAREQELPVCLLGGGSNTIFADEGYPGLVLQVSLRGMSFREDDPWVYVTAAAGEPWDDFVRVCLERDLAGVECLSGIPGTVGATPIQNVGAYGQEVGETIVSLAALERSTLRTVEFSHAECGFGYRRSRFKAEDRGRYVITAVTYRLRRHGQPTLRYPELAQYVEHFGKLDGLEAGRPALEAVRGAVLELRRGKSMLLDPADPHSRSVGSFFLNPILSPAELRQLQERWRRAGGGGLVPSFSTPEGFKVPAAWLVERAGFPRGYRRGGVGISARHCLALVNYGGTTREILGLAADIQSAVHRQFGVRLEPEPEVEP